MSALSHLVDAVPQFVMPLLSETLDAQIIDSDTLPGENKIPEERSEKLNQIIDQIIRSFDIDVEAENGIPCVYQFSGIKDKKIYSDQTLEDLVNKLASVSQMDIPGCVSCFSFLFLAKKKVKITMKGITKTFVINGLLSTN